MRDLTRRGLRAPLLVISDGAPGLISAIEQVFPQSLRQLIHRARNAIAKVSSGDQDEVKADYWSIFDSIEAQPGEAALAEGARSRRRVRGKVERLVSGRSVN